MSLLALCPSSRYARTVPFSPMLEFVLQGIGAIGAIGAIALFFIGIVYLGTLFIADIGDNGAFLCIFEV